MTILGFPCNQFANQEPGSEEDIKEACTLNYGVDFPMFAKIDVNGENAHPIFEFLKREKRGLLGRKIKWNFTKFLIDRTGMPVRRYAPVAKPEKLEKDIEAFLT